MKKVLPWCLASIPAAVFILLLLLRVAGAISCSWWLVTLPLWGVFALVGLFCVGIVAFFSWWERKHPDAFSAMTDQGEE